MMTPREDPCLRSFLAMVDGGHALSEFIREHYLEDAMEALRRDSESARLLQGPRPRPLYFQVPRRPNGGVR